MRGEGVESVEYAVKRKDKKRMKGSEKEGEEAEYVGIRGGNDVEVEMEDTEGGGGEEVREGGGKDVEPGMEEEVEDSEYSVDEEEEKQCLKEEELMRVKKVEKGRDEKERRRREWRTGR
ncbi:hypothetical protein CesoFtcFv8_000372 [Champsocephalus esox]|uniref:Uncharacterized protein n=1 Tax=Champsocephalus esox TaxID=159716 RepID=A0AAN8DLJ0_9TELE|nr:hypothetical protein CesoFtcFv8_000372 [Champsocephalus esox]